MTLAAPSFAICDFRVEKTREAGEQWQVLRTVTVESEPISQANCINCDTNSIGAAVATYLFEGCNPRERK